jgi:hypothetical protein
MPVPEVWLQTSVVMPAALARRRTIAALVRLSRSLLSILAADTTGYRPHGGGRGRNGRQTSPSESIVDPYRRTVWIVLVHDAGL